MNLYLIIEEKTLEAPGLSFPSHKMGHILRPKSLIDKRWGYNHIVGRGLSRNLEHSWLLDRQALGHPGHQVT